MLQFFASQPRFAAWSPSRQAWESIGGALLTGVLGGLALGASPWLYLLVVLISFVGGAPAGAQHWTLLGAELRALVAGSVWAAAVFVTSSAVGSPPTVALPATVVAFLPWGFLPACAVATIVWLVTRRARRREVQE